MLQSGVNICNESKIAYLKGTLNEVFARKVQQKEIGQLEHNKPCRLHHLQILINYEDGLKFTHQN